jgi:hypothetical protein
MRAWERHTRCHGLMAEPVPVKTRKAERSDDATVWSAGPKTPTAGPSSDGAGSVPADPGRYRITVNVVSLAGGLRANPVTFQVTVTGPARRVPD